MDWLNEEGAKETVALFAWIFGTIILAFVSPLLTILYMFSGVILYVFVELRVSNNNEKVFDAKYKSFLPSNLSKCDRLFLIEAMGYGHQEFENAIKIVMLNYKIKN